MPGDVKITGFMPVRNGIRGGYPFLECIVAALPLVDEFVVNDGGSDDGTRDILERLVEVSPVPVKIIDYYHASGIQYEGLDRAIEYVLSQISGGWVIEVQADELIPPRLLRDWHEAIKYANEHGYNSIRHVTKWLIRWQTEDSYPYRTIRAFRWSSNIRSSWGGDNFYYDGQDPIRDGYTSHNLPPELDVELKIYNLDDMFPGNAIERAVAHYCYYARGASDRRFQYEIAIGRIGCQLLPYPVYNPHPDIPDFFTPLFGKVYYQPNLDVLDKEWLLTYFKHARASAGLE